jgi:ribonuclease T
MANRFRGFLPIVVDVECGGFNPNTDALLEIAAVLVEIQGDGTLKPGEGWRYHVQPFPGARKHRSRSTASIHFTRCDPQSLRRRC